MKRTFIIFMLSLSMLSGGCAAIVSNLPAIIAAVMDAEIIVNNLADFVDRYFKAKPNEDQEKKIHDAIARTRSALDLALRASQGGEKLDQAKIDEAFKDFKVAYTDLMVLLWPLGVSAQGNTFKAIPGGLVVPEPMALTLKAR